MANFTPVGVEAVIKNERNFMQGVNGMQAAITGFATAAATAAIQGVAQLTKAVAGLATSTVESSISVESAFAGVIKTTDGLIDETGELTRAGADLKEEFRELALSTPVEEVEELMEIGELGGQLGIAREDLIEFTETIAAMGVATNLTTEEAATQFAQLANIMGTTEREGSQAFGKLGSSIVALGNNFATTEADISNFASRIAGAGQVAGVSEADILGIGAAMSSVGVQAEAGGTAVQKVLLNINQAVTTGSDELDVFAATAGLTVDEFADLWEQDAGDAFTMFVEGLGAAGDDAILVLQELGLQDQRLIRSFLSLANAGDLLEETLYSSRVAWNENNALTKEAAQRYATTESQVQLVKNQIRDLSISVGDTFRTAFEKGLVALQPFLTQIGERLPVLLETYVAPALQRLTDWLGNMLPKAIQFLSDLWTGTLQPAIAAGANIWETRVIPVLKVIGSWFQQLLPIAIDVVVTYWNTYLLPLFQSLREQWDSKVQPALAELFTWLQERVPQAIETARKFWEGTLKPAFAVVAGFIVEKVVPVIGDVVAWLIRQIPKAIDVAAKFWKETLQPALAQVWAFIQENVIPIIEDVVAWLQENIPKAIREARKFWEETLLPALRNVWSFIQENVIPIIETVVAWLQENIPVAIETAREYWEEVLKPALETVWEFLDEHVFPLLKSIADFFKVAGAIAIEGFALLWETVLQPALEVVWEFIDQNILPIFESIRKTVVEDVMPALEPFATFLKDTLGGALDAVAGAFKKATDFLAKFLDKIREWRGTDIPEDYQPGSPPPLFYALVDIGTAMAELSQVQIPALTAQMTGLGRATAGGAPSGSITNNNTITFNSTITGGIGMAAFQARTLRTVQGAVA